MKVRPASSSTTQRYPQIFSCFTLFALLLPAFVAAQFPSRDGLNLTTVNAPHNPAIRISYKEPKNVCKTAFSSQKQYTGWVTIPGSDFEANVFFWFVGSREPTDALTIWLNGGPGSSSLFGFFTGNGPCDIIEKGIDQYETVARQWGWDRASNMLFIDQPNQVGLSFDQLTNLSLDLILNNFTQPEPLPDDRSNFIFRNGTFSSGEESATSSTTEAAAKVMWDVVQGFMGAFPQLVPPRNSSLGINLFAESYGGKYAPVFAQHWQKQNTRRLAGQIDPATTVEIRLTSIGIINGCIDDLIQSPYYVQMASDNVYGIKIITPTKANLAMGKWENDDNGCRVKLNRCRELAATLDPDNLGIDEKTNEVCRDAQTDCFNTFYAPFTDADRSDYDIVHRRPDPFPSSLYLEYLNTPAVQKAIGTSLNFTQTSSTVSKAFTDTGDQSRGSLVPLYANLLNQGVRVALIYGDRDFICNWLGGEAISYAIAEKAAGHYAYRFPAAGYAPIVVNDSYVGGVVRQFGNLSFSRIYQAGHFATSYQPETLFQLFARVILGRSLSLGNEIDLDDYDSIGRTNSTRTFSSSPPKAEPTCYIRDISMTCDKGQIDKIKAGEGVVINGVWYEKKEDWPLFHSTPSSTSTPSAGSYTGIFTATAAPPEEEDAATSTLAQGLSSMAACCILFSLSMILL